MNISIIINPMFLLPDQARLEEVYSYTQIFALTLLWNVGIYGMVVFVAFIILLILKLYQQTKLKQQSLSRQSLLTYQSGTRQSQNTIRQSANNQQQEQPLEQQANVQGRRAAVTPFDVLNFFTSLTFYLTLVAIALLYLGIYMFGYMGRGTGHDIMAVLVMLLIVALPTAIWKYKTKVKTFKQIKKQVIFTTVMLFLWLGLSIFLVIVLKGVCICAFNDNYGIHINDVFMFSTEWTRANQITKVCPGSSLCHLYATLAEDTAHSVFINAHTGLKLVNMTIVLSSGASTYTQNLTNPISITNIQDIGQRNVFSAYFDKLTPDSTYSVVISNTDTGTVLSRTNYRTLPDQSAEEIRMAVGGDVGLDKDAHTLTSYLVPFDPHVVIIGGDIAYDDGMKNCFYSWDNFYQIFEEELNGKLNRLVPMIMTVGNHDVGFDALATVDIDMSDLDSIPNFFIFNPQHLTAAGGIPDPQDRSSFHLHVIGPTVHAHLDSGYIQSYKNQKYFIELVSKTYPNHYRFANYHNPLYPSCTNSNPGSNDVKVISQGTKQWTPLFDQGNFTAVFQHHTHHRKFTKKIKNNTVSTDNTGTRYIGDGSWGVPEGGCGASRVTPYPEHFVDFQTNKSPNHIWKVKVIKTTDKSHTIEYTAIDINNTVVFSHHDDL